MNIDLSRDELITLLFACENSLDEMSRRPAPADSEDAEDCEKLTGAVAAIHAKLQDGFLQMEA